jgi:pyocin large subunit-like protein
MAKRRTPIDALIDNSDLRCMVCRSPMGTCDCWTKCACGWLFEKDTKCRNPIHGGNKTGILRAVALGKGRLP